MMTDPTRIGVFGGSFDPIHVGHLIIAEIMRHRLKLSEVIFLPAGRPPHKPGQILSTAEHRLAMLALALGDSPAFSVSRIDIDRGGASYTADSLRSLRAQRQDSDELYFLMGQDSLRDFPTWQRPDWIASQARLGLAMRPRVNVALSEVEAAVPETRGRVEIVSVPLIGISSRELRATIRDHGPFRFQVVPAVADYIVTHGLYQD